VAMGKNSAKVALYQGHHILELHWSLSVALINLDSLVFLHKPTELGRVVVSQDGDSLAPQAFMVPESVVDRVSVSRRPGPACFGQDRKRSTPADRSFMSILWLF